MPKPAISLSTAAVLLTAALVVPGAPSAGAPAAASPISPANGAAKASPRSSGKVVLGPATGAVQALAAAPDVPKGIGPVHNATFVSAALSDRLEVKINVGSGNLMIRRSDLALPGVKDSVTIGAAYNSLLVGAGLPTGAVGEVWRTRTGIDVRLVKADDGSVTYVAADGVTGVFAEDGAGGYTAPKAFKATLAKDGSGWKLTEHGGGRKLYFTAAGLLDRWTDRDNNTTDLVHDGGNRVVRIVATRGTAKNRTVHVGYDAAGRVEKYRQDGDDGTSRTVTYGYDTRGNLATVTDAINTVSRFEYDADRNVTAIVGPTGQRTTITYDAQHRVTSFTRVTDDATGKGATTRIAYTSDTETKVADANTDLSQPVTAVAHTTYTLDSEEHVTKVVDPAGNTRSATYTPYHDVATATSGEGGVTTNTYGANAGQSMTASASATGGGTSTAYANPNTAANPTAAWQASSSKDKQGNATTYTYNGAGNRTSTKDAQAADAKVDYNNDGTVKSATDPGNGTNATTYAYTGDTDNDGTTDKQLTTITPPTGNSLGVRRFTYDAYGRLRTSNDGAGRVTTYTYDANDRTTNISYSDGTRAVDYTFDASGNVKTRVDASGTTTYGYDKLDRLISRSATSGGGVLTYEYDPVGNITKLTDARGTTGYGYNNRNLQTHQITAGGTRYDFDYDNDGRRTTTWFNANPAKTTWAARTVVGFDKSGRIKRITTARASDPNKLIQDVSLCYSKYVAGQPCSTAPAADTGLRQWRTDHVNSVVTQYTYDKGNRLTAATNVNGCNYSISYDSRGNRTRYADGILSGDYPYSYNSANQITASANSPEAKHVFDGAGNATVLGEYPATEWPSGVKRLYAYYMNYNAAGQMTEKRPSNAHLWTSYRYAGPDQTELISVGDYRKYVYGRPNQYGLPQLQVYTEGSSTYYLELDGTATPIGFRSGGADYAYAVDEQGSPISLIDTSGNDLTRYTYGLDGQESHSAPYHAVAASNPIGYAGGIFVPDLNTRAPAAAASRMAAACGHTSTTGMTKFGKRYLPVPRHTAGGTFTQQDSINMIGDPTNGNRYAYAAANPINNTDPTGLMSGEAGVKVCYYLCLGGGIAGDQTGANEHPYLSVGIGAPSVGGGLMLSNSDVEQGWSGEVGCAAGPLAFSTGTAGSSAGVGTYASSPECDAGVKYTFGSYN